MIGEVEKTMELPEEVQAPIQKGECAGRVVYKADGEELGSVAIYMEQTWQEPACGTCSDVR